MKSIAHLQYQLKILEIAFILLRWLSQRAGHIHSHVIIIGTRY